MFTSTLSRPRWAIPMIADAMPKSAARPSTASSTTMALSAPSMPKRFWPTYLVSKKRSRASAAFSRSRMCSFSSSPGAKLNPSTCSWSQRFSSGSWMCMYSTPTVRQ